MWLAVSILGANLVWIIRNRIEAAEGAITIRCSLVDRADAGVVDDAGDDGAEFIAEFNECFAVGTANPGSFDCGGGSAAAAWTAWTEGI